MCPACGGTEDVQVVMTAPTTCGAVVRRRRCGQCGERWYTLASGEYLVEPDRLTYKRNLKLFQLGDSNVLGHLMMTEAPLTPEAQMAVVRQQQRRQLSLLSPPQEHPQSDAGA